MTIAPHGSIALRTRHVPWLSRVEAHVGGRRLGFLRYDVRGTWAVLAETEVPDEPARAGVVGGVLVAAALDLLRGRGHRILTACPGAQAVLDRHPEWCDGVDDLPRAEVVTLPALDEGAVDRTMAAGVVAPDVVGPGVLVPEVVVPDVVVPGVAGLPEVAVPDVAVPDVVVPDLAVPQARTG